MLGAEFAGRLLHQQDLPIDACVHRFLLTIFGAGRAGKVQPLSLCER
jgi:hypothetical protein